MIGMNNGEKKMKTEELEVILGGIYEGAIIMSLLLPVQFRPVYFARVFYSVN